MTMRPDSGSQDEGVLRPDRVVLGADALIPEDNLVRPPPRRFTHELAVDEAYRFDRGGSGRPDGVLTAGTRVVVAQPGAQWSRVIDDRGLAVEVRTGSLRRLPGTR